MKKKNETKTNGILMIPFYKMFHEKRSRNLTNYIQFQFYSEFFFFASMKLRKVSSVFLFLWIFLI